MFKDKRIEFNHYALGEIYTKQKAPLSERFHIQD